METNHEHTREIRKKKKTTTSERECNKQIDKRQSKNITQNHNYTGGALNVHGIHKFT